MAQKEHVEKLQKELGAAQTTINELTSAVKTAEEYGEAVSQLHDEAVDRAQLAEQQLMQSQAIIDSLHPTRKINYDEAEFFKNDQGRVFKATPVLQRQAKHMGLTPCPAPIKQ